jgi:hypothetical protein
MLNGSRRTDFIRGEEADALLEPCPDLIRRSEEAARGNLKASGHDDARGSKGFVQRIHGGRG